MLDILIFWISKVLWGIFAPSHFIVLILILSVFFVNNIYLKILLRFVSLFFLILAFLFPIGDWVLLPLEQCNEQQSPPLHVDGVLVLGGAVNIAVTDVRTSVAFNGSADRVMALLKLLKVYPGAQFVYAGGTSSIMRPDFHEAEYIKRFLDDLGTDTSKMVFEGLSRSTFEDAQFTKETFSKTPGQNWLLVTSSYHMPRALSLFEKVGQPSSTKFTPFPVDYKTPGKFSFEVNFDLLGNLEKYDIAMHEYVGLIINKMMHRTDEMWPCSLKSLLLK